MSHAGRIAILHRILIGPTLGPIGAHRDECMRRNTAVLRLPGLHILDGQCVIRILGNLGMHVDTTSGNTISVGGIWSTVRSPWWKWAGGSIACPIVRRE